ncbi:unnamed protein product [Prunus armeniaca]
MKFNFLYEHVEEYDEHLEHEYEHMSESEEASEYVCSEEESSQTDSFVEGLIEARMGVHEGEMAGPSVKSGSEAYRKMQKKYKVLEASVDRVLALAHTPEVGSSNQTSPSESVGIAMVSASEGVDIRVGVPLGNRNTLTEAKLVELRTDYSVPSYVGLRLPSAADVVRYPPEYAPGPDVPAWSQTTISSLGTDDAGQVGVCAGAIQSQLLATSAWSLHCLVVGWFGGANI